jgi:hypothetical protein
VLGVTKSRIASGGVINRTAKSIHRTDIIGMRRRITQPGCPHFRRIAEGIAAVLTPSGPFFMSTRDDWKQCPLLAQSGHRLVRCKCLLLTQSGHRADGGGAVKGEICDDDHSALAQSALVSKNEEGGRHAPSSLPSGCRHLTHRHRR